MPASHSWVKSDSEIQDLLRTISDNSTQPPPLFLDLEGVNLSRAGTISIMQMLIPPKAHVFLIDIHRLEARAFSTSHPEILAHDPSRSHFTSLKTILESPNIPKFFFDVRNDSGALHANFDIHLRGTLDIQLLEFLSRSGYPRNLSGLANCIKRDARLATHELHQWDQVKKAGKALFDPEGGPPRHELFNAESLDPILEAYCVQDVLLLPKLLQVYAERLRTVSDVRARHVQRESLNRVAESQKVTSRGKGDHMALGPSSLLL
ncbi:MAG: hypothetical protein Q9227_005892 [Pyrenula ochraceoflavens]